MKRYKASNRPISVDFRKMVDWLKPDSYTHIIHPYPAKLLMHIPHFFLANNLLSPDNGRVIDPFCGSGTVLLEAKLSGRRVMGADTSPFARLLTKVKIQGLNSKALKVSYKFLKKRVPEMPSISMPDVVNLKYWFYPRIRKQLLCIYEAIGLTKKDDYRKFFLICFSKCVRKVSLADPRLAVPVKLNPEKYTEGHWLKAAAKKRLCWLKRVDVSEVFEKIVLDNIKRMEDYSKACKNTDRSIIACDARDMTRDDSGSNIDDLEADLVITSPPYAGAQKYIRSVSLNLGWLEICKSNELVKYKSTTIGREEYPKSDYHKFVGTDIPSADRILKTIYKKYPLRSHIAANYLIEMKSAFEETYRVLKARGYFVLVVGDNQICQYNFRTSRYLRHILEELGFKIKLCLIDDIKSRGLMTKRNKTASIITREWVMLFEKG